MVRCSIKRLIKLISVLLLVFLVLETVRSILNRSSSNVQVLRNKYSKIIILASRSSISVQRFILFLNELRSFHVQVSDVDERFYQDLIKDPPIILILDKEPSTRLRHLIKQYRIGVIIFLTTACKTCVSIDYSQMSLETISYPTINYARDNLLPIEQQSLSPYHIEKSTNFVTILRFDKILPHFHHQNISSTRCFGLRDNILNEFKTVIYVYHRLSRERVNLLIISENTVQISTCLHRYWFIWPLIMDSLKYLTSGSFNHYGFKRHIQIDIDDIFLGRKTIDHFRVTDVRALISSQAFIQQYIKNFRYRLAYSGYYFDTESIKQNESDGDRLLIGKL